MNQDILLLFYVTTCFYKLLTRRCFFRLAYSKCENHHCASVCVIPHSSVSLILLLDFNSLIWVNKQLSNQHMPTQSNCHWKKKTLSCPVLKLQPRLPIMTDKSRPQPYNTSDFPVLISTDFSVIITWVVCQFIENDEYWIIIKWKTNSDGCENPGIVLNFSCQLNEHHQIIYT